MIVVDPLPAEHVTQAQLSEHFSDDRRAYVRAYADACRGLNACGWVFEGSFGVWRRPVIRTAADVDGYWAYCDGSDPGGPLEGLS